jgi:GNAT superfamily N-acetyltransferase
MARVEVTRTYLQMLAPEALQPAPVPEGDWRIERVRTCPASFYSYLYREVGRAYHWVDRADWDEETVRSYLGQPSVALWVLFCEGAPAGYFELVRHLDGSTEIAYFGLVPDFHGRGLGKHLLTVAVREAWGSGAQRVWLHTCTLDGPAALPNYLKRGFQPYRSEVYYTKKARIGE